MFSKIVVAVAAGITCVTALAQVPSNTVKIGVLSDFTGVYASWGAKGSVLAAEMAVEDHKKANPNFPYKVEIVSADFQLKTDLAVSISKKWIDEGINAIVDIPWTAAALAVTGQAKGTGVAVLVSGGGQRSRDKELLCQHGSLDLRYVCDR